MEDGNQYRDAILLGLRRAGLHWIRASYEVVAGVGALLDEVAQARRAEGQADDEGADEAEGPVRIEID